MGDETGNDGRSGKGTDIVTRLRAMALRCWCAEKSQGEPVGKPFFRCEACDDQLIAADEIERLRAELDAARAERDLWHREATA